MSGNFAKVAGGMLRRFSSSRSGDVLLMFALIAPVLLLVTAGGLDYFLAVREKSRLQRVVDAAALAAANELSMSNSKTENVGSIVDAFVSKYVLAVKASNSMADPVVTTQVVTEPLQVRVSATQAYKSVLGSNYTFTTAAFSVTAVAEVVGHPNICVLVLNPTENGALSLEQQANVTGVNCAVFSNSTHSAGVKTKNSAILKASTICSAGGFQGTGKNFDPPPFMDCPAFEDPLSARPEPDVGTCNPGAETVISTSRVLSPGTYCGLTIRDGADVQFSPGIYVIKDAPLVVTAGGRLSGKGVGIFVTGANAYFQFDGDSAVSLEAPTTGPMTGLLLFASRQTSGLQHKIYSENAQNMVGTIYIPTGELLLDGAADVGSQSAYTAVVTNKLRMYGGPHIVLNTRYSETDVPVPEGIKGAGQPIQLVE